MRTETQTTYIAFDGKSFTNERDCRCYEDNLKKDLIMIDVDGNYTTDYDYAWGINIRNDIDVEILEQICEDLDVYSPFVDIEHTFRGIIFLHDGDWVPYEEFQKRAEKLMAKADSPTVNW